MGNILLLLLLIPFMFGCSSIDRRYDDIDFIAYSWRLRKIENPIYENEWHLYCRYYTLIDNTGQCRVIVERFYPKSEKTYCKIRIDRKLLNEVVTTTLNFVSDSDFRPKPPILYDGPSLKLRINKNSNKRTVHFYNLCSSRNEVFINLYQVIDSLIMSKSFETINDTLVISIRKKDFIKYSIQSDSILKPLAPIPTKEDMKNVKYKSPVIVN